MRKKNKYLEEEGGERWLVSYADFITLLFAFFVVLYATSQKDLDKQEEFRDSIKKYLLNVSGAGSGESGSAGANAGSAKSFDHKDSMMNAPIKNFRKLTLKNSAETLNIKKSVEKDLQKNIKQDVIAKYIRDVGAENRGVVISLYSKTLFADNSAKIYSQSSKFLDKLGDIISKFKGPIHLLGHSSQSKLKNTKYSSEWELSSDRSIKLLRYLSKRFNISQNRFVASAYGSTQPLFDKNKNGKHKNNRIDILLVTQ